VLAVTSQNFTASSAGSADNRGWMGASVQADRNTAVANPVAVMIVRVLMGSSLGRHWGSASCDPGTSITGFTA
jgi:hypothetical protein